MKSRERLIKPVTSAAIVLVWGFWISQLLALYFVTGSMLGIVPKATGASSFNVFTLLFILGLASLSLFLALYMYLLSPAYDTRVASTGTVAAFSLGLALAGLMFDAEKWRQSGCNVATRNRPLKAMYTAVTSPRYAAHI